MKHMFKFRSAESQATHEVQFVGISCTALSRQIFGAYSVDILVVPSLTGYMVTSLGFSLLMWGYIPYILLK